MTAIIFSFRRESPKDYRLIRNFVVDYLYASGHDVMKMADNVKINYGDRLTTNEDCIEEIVCNSIMAIAGDESAMKKALQVAKAEQMLLKTLPARLRILYSLIPLTKRPKHLLRMLRHLTNLRRCSAMQRITLRQKVKK